MAIEKMLIQQCSATLASIKTASLFNMDVTSMEELEEQINIWNQRMESKGLCLFVLKVSERKALVYVYRKKKLWADLQRKDVRDFLKRYGYESGEPKEALNHLKSRFATAEEFPHEIGVFLDYPLEDVYGFIKNRGQNYKLLGHWKVYGDEEKSREIFQKYKRCREIYMRLWKQGRSVMQLTVAV